MTRECGTLYPPSRWSSHRDAQGRFMRLLFATHSLADLAGAPLHAFELCRGFRRAGHDVSVVALDLGTLSDALKEEGFTVLSLHDYRALRKETFDLIYLHHATCEVLLGLMFGGRIPIVRGYLGNRSSIGYPINGGFSDAALYLSEEIRETMIAKSAHDRTLPYRISRNVYEDSEFPLQAALRGPPEGTPNFAVVTNHFDTDLAQVLQEGQKDGLCRFTHFGHPGNSTTITADLLASFDAVISIYRTVLPAAALGLPVYVCDTGGSDGWLVRENYEKLRDHTFSGRVLGIRDQDTIRGHLLDKGRWPTVEDLTWVSERTEEDHALARRVGELEAFFAEVVGRAPEPVNPPDGYGAVFNYIGQRGEGERREPGRRNRRREAVDKLKAAEAELKARDSRIRELEDRLGERETHHTSTSAGSGLSKAVARLRNRLPGGG